MAAANTRFGRGAMRVEKTEERLLIHGRHTVVLVVGGLFAVAASFVLLTMGPWGWPGVVGLGMIWLIPLVLLHLLPPWYRLEVRRRPLTLHYRAFALVGRRQRCLDLSGLQSVGWRDNDGAGELVFRTAAAETSLAPGIGASEARRLADVLADYLGVPVRDD